MKTGILLLLICLLLNIPSFAEQKYWRTGDPFPKLKSGLPWPKLNEIIIKGSVTPESNNFRYSYLIHNSTKNWLPIYSFEIDLRKKPEDHPFLRADLSIVHSVNEHFTILDNVERSMISNILIPNGWGIPETVQYSGPIRIVTNDPVTEVKPGKRINFKYYSELPIGIRDFIAEAYSNEYVNAEFDIPEKKLVFYTMSPDLELEINKGIEYLGKTIAPVAPPEPFTASSWTARMAEYAAEARKQKWIKTDKTLAEIKKLISALNTEDKGKLKEAVKKTESYVLAEKKKGNLTDEADALVRLNALYLLGRLGSPGEKPNDGANK